MALTVTLVTVFREYFSGPFACGPTRVAQASGQLTITYVNPRDFAGDRHRTVDDYPFGGGAGMVLKPGPIVAAIQSVRRPDSRIVLLTPRGRRFTQQDAERYAGLRHLVLVCGRYKGIDERVTMFCDEELSLGDFILAGGEAAAVAVVESTARLLPDAVGNVDSVTSDSFATGILDAPYYTRPANFDGHTVPTVLLDGDHAAVLKWRRCESLITTARFRPDLLQHEVLNETERNCLCERIMSFRCISSKEPENGESSCKS